VSARVVDDTNSLAVKNSIDHLARPSVVAFLVIIALLTPDRQNEGWTAGLRPV
jgi:hypothetical protein